MTLVLPSATIGLVNLPAAASIWRIRLPLAGEICSWGLSMSKRTRLMLQKTFGIKLNRAQSPDININRYAKWHSGFAHSPSPPPVGCQKKFMLFMSFIHTSGPFLLHYRTSTLKHNRQFKPIKLLNSCQITKAALDEIPLKRNEAKQRF